MNLQRAQPCSHPIAGRPSRPQPHSLGHSIGVDVHDGGSFSPLTRLSFCCTPLSLLVVVSIWMELGCQQCDRSLVNGAGPSRPSRPGWSSPSSLASTSTRPSSARPLRIRTRPDLAVGECSLSFCRHPLSIPIRTPSAWRRGCSRTSRPGRRREFCHSADTPCLSLVKHLMKVQGGAIKMTVSPPTAARPGT